jgi:hemoglobin
VGVETAGDSENLWEQAGGEPVVRRVLQRLYDRLFEDRMVGFLFEGKDKAHIVEQQVRFTSGMLGGPFVYEGKALPAAHAALPLLAGHVDRRHHLLGQVLREEKLPDPVIEAWLARDAGLKNALLRAGEEARAKAKMP